MKDPADRYTPDRSTPAGNRYRAVQQNGFGVITIRATNDWICLSPNAVLPIWMNWRAHGAAPSGG